MVFQIIIRDKATGKTELRFFNFVKNMKFTSLCISDFFLIVLSMKAGNVQWGQKSVYCHWMLNYWGSGCGLLCSVCPGLVQ